MRTPHRSSPSLPALAGLLAAVITATPLAGAQTGEVARRVVLPGNVHPLAQARYDKGPVAPDTRTGRLRLLLKRSPAQDADLEQMLGSMHDSGSPNYRHWLTPAEYGARFGASASDIGTVSTWLRQQGFKVAPAPASKAYVEFSGAMSGVEHAFRTSVHSYAVSGAVRIANATNPSIPAAIAPLVAGISPLNNFQARAQTQASVSTRIPLRSSHAAPLLSDPRTGTVYVTPAEAATVYNAPNTLNRNFAAGGAERKGTGVRIGIAGYSDLQTADYLNYRRVFLNEAYPASPTTIIDGIDPGVLDQHDGQVTLIAAEVAAGLAPGADISVYSSQSDLLESGLTNAIIRAIEDNDVSILAVSYSTCETALGASGNALYNELWKQAAAQGISVVAAAGDTGAAGCDDGHASTASQGLGVNGLASSPYALAVGGTDFDTLSAQFRPFIADPGAPPSEASFAGYVPEAPWNDSISNLPVGDFTSDIASRYTYGTRITAGGGGASSAAYCAAGYAVDGSCSGPLTGYPLPSFQVNAAAGHPTRSIPDVSLFAGTHRQYAATWAVCSDNLVAQADYTFTDCAPGQDGSFSVEGAGGTGVAAPAFAGMLAVLVESLGPANRIGAAANGLYNLAANTPAVFHDIAQGNNSVPCAPGSADCGGNGFLTGNNAAQGYDLATGLGSVDLSALIKAWPNIAFTPTQVALTANNGTAPVTIMHGDTVAFDAAVTPNSAAGQVSLRGPNSLGGLGVSETIDLGAGGTGGVRTQKLPGGTYSVAGYYAGDATHAASTSTPIQVTVQPEDSILRMFTEVQDPVTGAVTADTHNFLYGTYGFLYVQPVGSRSDADGPATGKITVRNGSAPLALSAVPSVQTLNSVGRAAYPLAYFLPGSYQVSADYGGDASYHASTTTSPITLTIQKAHTALSAQSSAPSVDISGTVTITVTLNTQSTGEFPSGGILLSGNGKSFAGSIRQVLTPEELKQEVAVFQVPASELATGANTLTASYPGDANYESSQTTVTVTVTGTAAPATSFSLAGPSDGITLPSTATSAKGTVTLQSLNGFTGTVSLSCAFEAGGTGDAPLCAVTPSVKLSANGTGTATVTITAPLAYATPSKAGLGPNPFDPRGAGEGALALCSLLMFVKPVRTRIARSPLAILLVAGLLGTAGCGVHVTGHLRQSGVSTVIVTGTSGPTTATAKMLVNVE